MKKTTIALACAALLFLPGASVWEGSAVVAGSGELPETGYYIATNSFPRNTIVDVKNLETEKTVRAIVAGGLDSPGLLASLSTEAASAIGLARRSVGRIRVTMPADPIAFSRFTEGLAASSDPDRNPRAAAGKSPPKETIAPPVQNQTTQPTKTAPTKAPEPQTDKGPIVKAETEKKADETPKAEKIIDVPENYVPPTAETVKEDTVRPESNIAMETPKSDVAVELSEHPVSIPEPAAAEAPATTASADSLRPEASIPTPALTVEGKADLVEEPKVATEETPEIVAAPSAPPVQEPAETTQPTPVIIENAPAPAVAETTPEPPAAESDSKPTVETPPPAPETATTNVPAPPVESAPPQPAGEVVLDLRPTAERPPETPKTDISKDTFVEPIPEIAVKEEAPELKPELFLPPVSAKNGREETQRPTSRVGARSITNRRCGEETGRFQDRARADHTSRKSIFAVNRQSGKRKILRTARRVRG